MLKNIYTPDHMLFQVYDLDKDNCIAGCISVDEELGIYILEDALLPIINRTAYKGNVMLIDTRWIDLELQLRITSAKVKLRNKN